MAALRAHLNRGEAVAFLGAGASAPLYPLWGALARGFVDEAVIRGLSDRAAETYSAEVQPLGVVTARLSMVGRQPTWLR